MDASLLPHPTTADGPVRSIGVHVTRVAPAELTLRYTLDGDLGRIVIPEHAAPARTDLLWQHSCFETFIRSPGEAGYCEFNLSPSSQWAAYRFTDYRDGMIPLDVQAPSIRTRAGADELVVQVLLDLSGVVADEDPLDLAISAVIEQKDGRRNYWALAHAAGKPDFHHRDCFVLQLPPAKHA